MGCVRLHRDRRPGRAVAVMFAVALCGVIVAGCSGASGASTPGSAAAVVVGIGDSVTAATDCGCPGFVEPYAKDLPTSGGGPARGVNLGANGLTAAGLLQQVTTPTPTADGVAQADTLLVTIGANDLLPLIPKWRTSGCPATCYGPAVDTVGSDISGILAAAKSLRGSKPLGILVTNYWNVFADGDVASASETPAYLAWSDEITRALNTRICAAARGASAICVDLYAPFKGNGTQNPTKFLAGDGDHPNAAGYKLITSALLQATPPKPR
jgi:lysophospholipase L1-like esterase